MCVTAQWTTSTKNVTNMAVISQKTSVLSTTCMFLKIKLFWPVGSCLPACVLAGFAISHVVRSHDVERPYSCKECQRTFFLPSRLQQHISAAHRPGRYACPFCCFRSHFLGGFRRHCSRCNAREGREGEGEVGVGEAEEEENEEEGEEEGEERRVERKRRRTARVIKEEEEDDDDDEWKGGRTTCLFPFVYVLPFCDFWW